MDFLFILTNHHYFWKYLHIADMQSSIFCVCLYQRMEHITTSYKLRSHRVHWKHKKCNACILQWKQIVWVSHKTLIFRLFFTYREFTLNNKTLTHLVVIMMMVIILYCVIFN